ncbi:hypothetical protein EGW08_003762 [Elysia chlorotica]|uniref:Uncharacterized protein n=1 Tax=Elysia chlorotica TaxID=188477 RepID=A0A3S1BHP4_ELYCH|nr:hypothetical protein EGW08_003762 [Elysia chlorotica]
MSCCGKYFALQILLESFLVCVQGEVNYFALGTKALRVKKYVATDSSSTIPPTLPTEPPIVTLEPATKVRYRLNLTNPGPSVLDSTLSFVAELKTESGEEIPSGMNFSYLWMNMADLKALRTKDEFKAKIPLIFPSQGNGSVEAGDYTMTVVVSEESNPSKILAFQTKKFVLTEKLNGHLHIRQDLEFQRLSNTFSTNREFAANAILLDQFEEEQKPHYQFFWFEDEKFIVSTQRPEVVTLVDKPGNFSLRSEVLATVAVNINQQKKAEGPNKLTEKGTKRGAGVSVGSDVKNGLFEEKLYFKDPLDLCYIDRVDTEPSDRDVKLGVSAVINITCEGSAPTAVCLNLTRYNGSAPLPTNQSCRPQTFLDVLHHQVKVTFNASGWHDVHFFIFNDVSVKRYTLAYYAYDPSSANIPALVLPAVFATLGLLVIVGGAAYIMRLRKKPLVEVADFDFHPTLNESSSATPGMRLSLVANTIKFMLSRRKLASPRPSKPSLNSSDLQHSGGSTNMEEGAHLYEAL